MARLTKKTRAAIPTKEFAGPGRSYPVNDRAHARAALSMSSRYADSTLKARVRAAVKAKYPGMT